MKKKPEPFVFPTSERHEKPKPREETKAGPPTEPAIDNGVEESFPASDPVSVEITKK